MPKLTLVLIAILNASAALFVIPMASAVVNMPASKRNDVGVSTLPEVSGINVDYARVGDASHFEFSGATNWNSDIKQESGARDRVTLRIAKLKPSVLEKLKSHTDSLIKSISINENGLDGLTEITFGLQPNVEFFNYVSESPSNLVVDFFLGNAPQDTPLAIQVNQSPEKGKAADSELSARGAAKLPTKKRAPAATDGVLSVDTSAEPQANKSEHQDIGSIAEKLSLQKDFSHGIFDGGDPEFRRFSLKDFEIRESAMIASRSNYYLPFPMLELGSKHLQSMIEAPPIYEIVPNDTQENKEARLLLTLFKNKRRAIFLQTADQFLTKYPKGPYEEVVRYMMADIHFDLWKIQASLIDFETAMGQYLYLYEKFPDSPLTTRTLLLTSYSFVARGDSFNAIKTFQRFVRMKPDSKYADQAKISLAEAYLALNRFDDALVVLDEVSKTAKQVRDRQEAAYRRGDVYFKRHDYDGAVKEYRGAIAHHPDAWSRFPNAYYNIAEAEFISGKYREALEDYRMFLVKFPDHEYGGYAMTRMGELLGILSGESKQMVGAFMESQFRYRATPGAGVARIRLLTQRMPAMKEKEMQAALFEIKEITTKYSPLGKGADAEKAKKEKEEKEANEKGAKGDNKEKAAEAPAEAPAGEHGEAAPAAEHATAEAEKPKEGGEHGAAPAEGEHAAAAGGGEHGKAGGGEKVEHVEKVEEKALAFEVKPVLPGIEEFTTLLVADGFSARKEFDRSNKDLVPYYQANPQSQNKNKIVKRIEKNIAEGIRASADRGDFMDALRRQGRFEGTWLKNTGRVDVSMSAGRAYEQAGVFKEAKINYAESLKRLIDIKKNHQEKERAVFETFPTEDSLRLRMAYVDAQDHNFLEAEKSLKEIKGVGHLTDREQIERAEVSAGVAEARGQADIAKKYLTDLISAWNGEPALTSPLLLRLARLQYQAKDFKQADSSLAKIIEMKNKSENVSDDVYAKALETRGDQLLARGKRGQAVEVYRDLLEKYEDARPLASIRYRIGQIHFEDGDIKSAEGDWSNLKADGKSDVWRHLADEQMKSAKWQTEYRKYLNRIPAAAESKLR